MSSGNVKTVRNATVRMNATAAVAAVGPWVESMPQVWSQEEALRRAQWTAPEETPAAPVAPVCRAHQPSPVPTEILATAPAWFRELVSAPRTSRYITVEGCEIHYQHWPNPSNPHAPGILFVPGVFMSAHAYDFIAPYFLQFGFQCAAVDYSGQGDSGHRESYCGIQGLSEDVPVYVHEVEAVLEDLSANVGFPPRPFVVGHSCGGWLSLMMAKRQSNLGGVVNVDAAVMDPAWGTPGFDIKGKRPDFKSYEVATGKYGLAFEDAKTNTPEFILRYMAHYSIVPSETFGGPEGCWTYKHHCRTFASGENRVWDPSKEAACVFDGSLLTGLQCRMAYIYGMDSQHPVGIWEGQHSLSECVEYMRMRIAKETAGGEFGTTPMIGVPGGQHNLLHDKPEVFLPMLSALLQEWRRAEDLEAAPEVHALSLGGSWESVRTGARLVMQAVTSKL